MRITLRGRLAVRKPEFRTDLLRLIGAGTPTEYSDLAALHAQQMARQFTAAVLCFGLPEGERKQKITFTNEEMAEFIKQHMTFIDECWNKALEQK